MFLVLHCRLLISRPPSSSNFPPASSAARFRARRTRFQPCCEPRRWTHRAKSLWLPPTPNSNPTTTLPLPPSGAQPVYLSVSPADAFPLPSPHLLQSRILARLTANSPSTNQARLASPPLIRTNPCPISKTQNGHRGHPIVGSSTALTWPRNAQISREIGRAHV